MKIEAHHEKSPTKLHTHTMQAACLTVFLFVCFYETFTMLDDHPFRQLRCFLWYNSQTCLGYLFTLLDESSENFQSCGEMTLCVGMGF